MRPDPGKVQEVKDTILQTGIEYQQTSWSSEILCMVGPPGSTVVQCFDAILSPSTDRRLASELI